MGLSVWEGGGVFVCCLSRGGAHREVFFQRGLRDFGAEVGEGLLDGCC